MALLAAFFDTPSFWVNYSSEKTSMPFFASACLIQNVFRKLAEPLAMAATKELIKVSLGPVNRLVIPEKSFLRTRATETEEPTAAEYPKAKSLVV